MAFVLIPQRPGAEGDAPIIRLPWGPKAHLSRPSTSIALRPSRQGGSAISFCVWLVIDGVVVFLLVGSFLLASISWVRGPEVRS